MLALGKHVEACLSSFLSYLSNFSHLIRIHASKNLDFATILSVFQAIAVFKLEKYGILAIYLYNT